MTLYPRSILAATTVCALAIIPSPASAVAVQGQGTWAMTLQARDLDGDNTTLEGYYDTALDITWLADANTVGTPMTWAAANTWAVTLDINGIGGWRLPTMRPIDGTTADDATGSYLGSEDRGHNVSAPGTAYAGSTASELAHLFYNTLGDRSYCDPTTSTATTCTGPQADYGLSNTGPFHNLQADIYWSGTDYLPAPNAAWTLHFGTGSQNGYFKTQSHFAWAVHEGDVGAAVVPLPAGVWLFASGLLGFAGVTRRNPHV